MNATLAVSVHAADVDVDGDMDVLGAHDFDASIWWYENDGNEDFTRHRIGNGDFGVSSVYAIDFDGDGDIDVLAGYETEIAWYQNNGKEDFAYHEIPTEFGLSDARALATDMDGDGDTDVLAAWEWGFSEITWYENDGNELFTSHTITKDVDHVRSVYAADVDGDGDKDVLSASWGDDKIAWHENDGYEIFFPHTITTEADGAWSVYAVDVDGDGDMDVLSASLGDDNVAWYENDGNETFATHIIEEGRTAAGASSVHAVDVDGDGDMDVVAALSNSDEITWYENDGSEVFTARTITTDADFAQSVFATDVDGDGDMDVLSASRLDDKIAWYENMGVVGSVGDSTVPSSFVLHQNHPNPFNPSTTIRFSLPRSGVVSLRIINLLGKEVARLVSGHQDAGTHTVQWDATKQPSGVYFYRLQAGEFVQTKKLMILK